MKKPATERLPGNQTNQVGEEGGKPTTGRARSSEAPRVASLKYAKSREFCTGPTTFPRPHQPQRGRRHQTGAHSIPGNQELLSRPRVAVIGGDYCRRRRCHRHTLSLHHCPQNRPAQYSAR